MSLRGTGAVVADARRSHGVVLAGHWGFDYSRITAGAPLGDPFVAERTTVPIEPNSRIVSDPNVMMGKPVIAGTRITVEHVLDELGGGRSIEELLAAHPRLTRAGVEAALLFAAKVLRSEDVLPPQGTDH